MARVILVDDDPSVRVSVAAALKQAGHSVVEASNGREAARLFAAETPDLVITDIFMPEQDGFEIIMKLRAVSTVPIIAMTGMEVEPAYLKVAESLGARRTLRKPFTMDELLSAIRDVLAKQV